VVARVGCGCEDCDMGGWDRIQKKMRRIEERKKGGRTLYTQPFPFRLSGPSQCFDGRISAEASCLEFEGRIANEGG